MKTRIALTNDCRLTLPDDGILTLSFRGSAAEIAIHLLAHPSPSENYLEGSSTTFDTYDCHQPQLKTDFYMAMHGLLTEPDFNQAHDVAVNIDNIAGKGFSFETRPARRENITGNAHAESIHLWCDKTGSLYLRVIGQDCSFPSDATNMLYSFSQRNQPGKMDGTFLSAISNFAELIERYGTKSYTPNLSLEQV